MLADTDVGSVITAGQSGVEWGYRLLALQLVLVPILYMAQELTVRLAIFTGRGHGELIRDTFGKGWAWVSALGLGIAATGALLTEFSGVAGVGELYGLPRYVSLSIAALALLSFSTKGSAKHAQVSTVVEALKIVRERAPELNIDGELQADAAIADVVGRSKAPGSPVAGRANTLIFPNLAAANIGSVIMPWMLFYQQSAIADKRLKPEHLSAARWDTAAGALLTQSIMAAVLIACAATIGAGMPDASLTSVGHMAEALTPSLGQTMGNLIFGLGVLGAGMVAAIVVSLAFAWGLGEVAGYRRALEHHPLQARWFYGVYAVCVVGGAVLVGVWPDLVSLSVAVQVMNALMLPMVLGFLVTLSVRALPAAHRLGGWYLWVVVAVAAVTCALGVFGGISGMLAG